MKEVVSRRETEDTEEYWRWRWMIVMTMVGVYGVNRQAILSCVPELATCTVSTCQPH